MPRLKRERYTGRNDQLNLKVTTETRSRFIELCNANPSMTQGELMERLIDSYQQA